MGTDVEIWMLFAPFWLLGIFAALGALWHFSHLGTHLHAHPASTESHHHFRRARLGIIACVCLLALGLVVGVLWSLGRG